MTIQLENYAILYADAPFELYDSTACLSVNLQLCEGDTYTHAFIPGTADDTFDQFVFNITPSGNSGRLIVAEMITGLVPAKNMIQVVLQNNNTNVATHLLEYGQGTLHSTESVIHMADYISAPYHNLYIETIPKSAYIIVNMPLYLTDIVTEASFIPGTGDEDTLLLSVTSADDPNEAHQTYVEILGPYELINTHSKGVELEVSVNGRTPVKSPMGKKSYGQDTDLKRHQGNSASY